MTYSVGQRILASDYNGLVSNNAANVNSWWATGSGSSGWGQTALATVDIGTKIYASTWAALVNTVKSGSDQTGTTITARTAPAKGDKISVFPGLITDITNIQSNRNNAVASGTTGSTWSGSAAYTSDINAGTNNWSLTWTNTVTFGSEDQARYFFNAGGLIRIDMSKTSTGKTKDSYWNDLIASIGTLYVAGGNPTPQTISGVSYTGFTRRNGSGTPTTYNTSYGWYNLTGYNKAYQQNQTQAPYTNDRVEVFLYSTPTVLTITVTWTSPSLFLASENGITGGTNTTSPYSGFGTAPAVVVRCVNPSSSYLSNTWGTPTVSESVALATSTGTTVNYLIVAGGGAGGNGYGNEGGGGGGAGGALQYTNVSLAPAASYSVVVGLGGGGGYGGGGAYNTTAYGQNSSFNGVTAIGGGWGGGSSISGVSQTGATGGSGGGGNGAGTGHPGSAGTPGQGTNGGYGGHHSGGGGGGGAGVSGSSGNPGLGGSGLFSNISGSGSYIEYAHGGNGGQYYGVVDGANGAPNTGNGGTGGGGSNDIVYGRGGAGGSGIVIISYDSAFQQAYGGTVTHYSGGTSGTIWVHTFTSSGSLTLAPQ